MNILVVDDKQLVLKKLTSLLEAQGFTVETANNGLDGYEKAQKTSYDLFIIDHLMPIMNGLQLAKNLKLDDQTVNFPIIFMTTQGAESVANSPHAELFYSIINKPIDDNYLLSLVDQLNNQKIQRISL